MIRKRLKGFKPGMLVMGALKQLVLANIDLIVKHVITSLFVKNVTKKIQSISINLNEKNVQTSSLHQRILKN
jgi:hypothetical protein